VVVLSLLVLILISGFLFGAVHIYGTTGDMLVSPHTLICFALLSNVVMLRRADRGVFSILLGSGIGGRFARLLAPFLILLPFVREAGRARLVDSRLIPPHYATAILASLAAMISLVFLLLLAWYINNMELEIRGLTLRDELTELYNLRGFTLLAEQALRLAQRSHLPFAVLFLDLDDLKRVNDSLGHDAGSAYIAETGQLLKDTFRETDVMARIGGDEFAVAGSFTESSIAIAAQRLRAAAEAKNAERGRSLPLTFSLGFTCASGAPNETLKDLLAEADRAMYSEKRGRKTGG
jgi:diguanylate cyclase (GGDEF)-like protein